MSNPAFDSDSKPSLSLAPKNLVSWVGPPEHMNGASVGPHQSKPQSLFWVILLSAGEAADLRGCQADAHAGQKC